MFRAATLWDPVMLHTCTKRKPVCKLCSLGVDHGTGCMRRQSSEWEIPGPSFKLCCEPNTVFKSPLYKSNTLLVLI